MKDKELKQFILNKDIAIVGNAKSVFNKKRPIDEHEIVIRINKGSPKEKEEIIGTRTDILALSLCLDQNKIESEFSPKIIVWCTPKYTLMNEYLQQVARIYPLQDWFKLYDILNARPSTGCMIIDYIAPYAKKLTLYGFDFWNSNTWYTNNIHLGEHNPLNEKRFITTLIENKKGQIIQ